MEFVGQEVSHVVSILKPATSSRRLNANPLWISGGVFLALACASWGYLLLGVDGGFQELFRGETWRQAGEFLGQLAGLGTEGTPAFLQWSEWRQAGGLAYDTLAMSVLAMGIAGIGALLTFLPAARNVATGELASSASLPSRGLYYLLRGLFIFSRGIPELIVAMIVVFAFSPGILAGAIALGIHNYGILGKLSAEVVEDLDPRSARALRTSGSSVFQMLAYGILPQALPQFLTYLLYRWEVVIRTTVVVGLVSAGGLGREFLLDMSLFRYTEVALLLIWYLMLVVFVDLATMFLRRLAR